MKRYPHVPGECATPNSNHFPDGTIEWGWLVMHESGTFVRFTQAGADLFA
jgi:hypothetical protein